MPAFKLFEDHVGQVCYIREQRDDSISLTVMVECDGRTMAGVIDDPDCFDALTEENAFLLVEEARQALR